MLKTKPDQPYMQLTNNLYPYWKLVHVKNKTWPTLFAINNQPYIYICVCIHTEN